MFILDLKSNNNEMIRSSFFFFFFNSRVKGIFSISVHSS